MITHRNQHEWDFIAKTPNGELGFCRLCNQFRYDTGKPFKMSKMEMAQLGPQVFAKASDKIAMRDHRPLKLPWT